MALLPLTSIVLRNESESSSPVKGQHSQRRPDTHPPSARLVERILGIYQKKKTRPSPLSESLRLVRGKGPTEVTKLLETLPPEWADHAIANIYALLMSAERRKQLGAYFTPPHLVDHLVARLKEFGLNPARDRIRDSAAGGAAFLVPLARIKVAAWKAEGASNGTIIGRLQSHLVGREIDKDLAALANALLRRMLGREFHISGRLVDQMELVQQGDSLSVTAATGDLIDHEIGNPPFFRLRGDDSRLRRKIFTEISSGRLNLYAMFVRRALEEVPPGGLVGYVIPGSFLGGPEFASFRRRILQIAEVLVVDLIERRSGVFLRALQDTCFVVLRRRASVIAQPSFSRTVSGILHRDGQFSGGGPAEIHADGAPWRLPGVEQLHTGTLKDWGYRATVGYLVANRQPERLHRGRQKADIR